MKTKRKVLLPFLCLAVCVYVGTVCVYTKIHDGLAFFKIPFRKTIANSKYRHELNKFANSIKFNVTENGRNCHDRRFLVYSCGSGCGGWGDRQKGITTMFLMALLTNRTFVIDMPRPCKLFNFLRPNTYDWSMCLVTAKRERPENVYHTYMMNMINLKRLNDLVSKNNEHFQVIAMQTNVIGIGFIREHSLSRTVLPWLSNLTDAEVTGSILGMLFKPTEDMHTALVQFLNDKVGNKKLTCAHIRYGRNPTIPNDSSLRFGTPNVSIVLNFLKTFDTEEENHVIFIATDSDKIRVQSRYYFSNFVSTDRQIVHVDKTEPSTSQSCDGFFTAIFEQWLLSKCDVLVLTRSNFGAMAAYMRGHSDSLFLSVKGRNDTLNVDINDIQKTYNFV